MKEIRISCKVSDMFYASLVDKSGNELGSYDGYVPEIIPGGYGDYVELNIDIETGKITNWKKPSIEEIKKTFNVNG